MHKLFIRRKFDAAHFLPRYKGKCHNVHGHTWKIEVLLTGRKSEKSGMVVDFKKIKKIIDNVLPDHRDLNNIINNPTAENLSEYLYESIEEILPKNLVLISISIFESDDCGVVYNGK